MDTLFATVRRQLSEAYTRDSHKPALYYLSLLFFSLCVACCAAGSGSIAATNNRTDPTLPLTLYTLLFAWPMQALATAWL